MNTNKNLTTINLWLNYINVLEAVIILMTYVTYEVCVPNKTEDLNLSAFNLLTGINESKTLTKHISCEYNYKCDGRKCNSNRWWDNDKCRCEGKKHHICEEDYIWKPAICSCEDGKYLASIIDNSVITCDEIIDSDVEAKSYDEERKTILKNIIFETKSFYILLAFLLITIALLIAVSIYCYLIKYKAKQKHLLPFYITNNDLKEVLY